jgi:hypothetical protein
MEIKNVEDKEKISYLNRELNRKNVLIKQLQQRILNLIDEKKSFINKINELKNEIYNISIKSEQNFNENKKIYDKKENELILMINKLKRELYEKEYGENNMNKILKKELIKAKEEINNLKIINNNRDNVLLLIHHFFQNIKNKMNLNYEIHLDFIPYIFDKSSFVNNLNILENEIINKISNNEKKGTNKNKEKTIKQKYDKNKKISMNNTIKTKREKSLFMNRFKQKEKNKINRNLNSRIKKGKSFIRTPPKKLINKINEEIIISRLNNTNYFGSNFFNSLS